VTTLTLKLLLLLLLHLKLLLSFLQMQTVDSLPCLLFSRLQTSLTLLLAFLLLFEVVQPSCSFLLLLSLLLLYLFVKKPIIKINIIKVDEKMLEED
jgi:hypothetical protein